MANLVQVASQITTPRGQAFLANILSNSKLLALLNASNGFELDKTVSQWIPVLASSVLQNRASGSNFTYTAVSPESAETTTQAIVGGVVPIDQTHLRDARLGMDVNNWFQKQLTRSTKAFAKELEIALVAGTGVSEIAGISKIVDGTTPLPGFAVTRALKGDDFTTVAMQNYIDLQVGGASYAEEMKKFLEMLWEGDAAVDGQKYLLVNQKMGARLNTIARENQWLGTDVTTFGMAVPTFNGIPIVTLSDGAIPNDEGNDDTTSLYIVSPGEARMALVSNGLQYTEYDFTSNTEAGVEKWEMSAGWRIEEPTAIMRLMNIKL